MSARSSCARAVRRPTRSGAAGRPGAPNDEGFAILYALIFVMLLTSFSLLLLSQLTSEVRQTRFARKHEQTLNTALAGLNAGLSHIRNSFNLTSGNGVPGLLPCTLGTNRATLTGSANPAGTQTWNVQIYYLLLDPANLTTTQVQALALPCPLNQVPLYAYLVSTGSQAAINGTTGTLGDRTLHAVYQFFVSNAQSLGGQVSYNTMCWDAGTAPVAGSTVTFQPCQASGTPSQLWYYRPDLSVRWYGDTSTNLCLDYRSFATAAPVKYMTLETCVGTGISGTAYDSITGSYLIPGQMYQEFSTNNVFNNVVAGGDRGSACVTSYPPGSGSYGLAATGDRLVMATSCGGAAAVSAGSRVGAGAAGGVTTGLPGPTQQLVNLAYFSRCLDVAASNPASGLITYPCHQAPDQTKVEGNQRFVYAGTTVTPGTITTVRSGFYSTVCLTGGAASATLVSCVPGQVNQTWTMTGYVIGSYAQSYLIKDFRGYCLTAAQPGGTVGTVGLSACDGSDAQKWNAPPGGAPSNLKAIGE